MAEIGFYHLTRTSLDVALPKLLGRVLATGGRAVVKTASEDRVAALDTALWLCPDPDWLPHGTRATGEADLQPIWLTTDDEAPNGARHLFLVEGAESARLAAFERVFDLFDGRDEDAVAAARQRWAAAKAAGHTLTYWRQTERGWEKG
ncbi:DNA polymerase III subunit chi [Elioraea tepidiphila]|jgi:DNA polymerase-3 subunit chi|uniref:DNA polymerase III subunit chi n=1 Tax=Elioraea tepidiphila TaxID=457934 RepID=UPI00037B7DB1|nr:DNA polymerase III subunit chi [Elioraea tepidiphila]